MNGNGVDLLYSKYKYCKWCMKQFVPQRKGQVFCCRECQITHWNTFGSKIRQILKEEEGNQDEDK